MVQVIPFYGIQHSTYLPFHLRTETIQFPKRCALYFLEYRTMENVENPNYSEWNTRYVYLIKSQVAEANGVVDV
jgi:hypothetical protein